MGGNRSKNIMREIPFKEIRCKKEERLCRATYANDKEVITIDKLGIDATKDSITNEILWQNKLRGTKIIIEEN